MGNSTAPLLFMLLLACASRPAFAMGPGQPPAQPPASETENPCVKDVEASLSALSKRGKAFRFRTSETYPTGSVRLPWGTAGFKFMRHIQGVTRLSDTNTLVLSGNADGGAYLYVAQIGSQPARGRWLSSHDPILDTVTQVIPLSSRFKHPGGIQGSGRIVAVGVDTEQGEPSEVRFFDFRNPSLPSELLHLKIARQNKRAEAIAFTRLNGGEHSGKYLIAVSAKQADDLTFYLSESADLLDPFNRFRLHATWKKNPFVNLPNYQAIQFVNQCDGKLFMLGSYKTKPANALPWGGKDWLELYRIDLDPYLTEPDALTGQPVPRIEHLRNKHMTCNDCFFSAGAGSYIEPSNLELKFYGTDYWPVDPFKRNSAIRFEEFAP